MGPLQTPEQRIKEIKKAAAKKRDAAYLQEVRERTAREKEKAKLLKERLLLKAQKEAEFKRDHAPLIAEHERGRQIEKARLVQDTARSQPGPPPRGSRLTECWSSTWSRANASLSSA